MEKAPNTLGTGYTPISQTVPLSDTAACRILVISPFLVHAAALVALVDALRNAVASTSNVPPLSIQSPASGQAIPWTIQNKYYSAPVHFEIHDVEHWRAIHAQGVPAVVFTWTAGENYKEHIAYLAKQMSAQDPEVLLAVRIARDPSSTSPVPTEEEDEGTDEFLLEHGFEFIDAREQSHNTHLSNDIPGLPRVLDALSTIMWPSMSQARSTAPKFTTSRERELYAWAQDEEDDSADAILESYSSKQPSGLHNELQELERWLEEESYNIPVSPSEEDPWKYAAWSASSSIASTSTGGGTGFDDNFTVFVSAPAATPGGQDQGVASSDSAMLLPVHTGASVGSVSEFGGSGIDEEDAGHVALASDDEEDECLPSQEEIRATSSQIFGSSPLSPTSPFGPHPHPVEGKVFEEEEPDFDLGAFDLSRVLGALQGMKDEIAGMSDQSERRKAAAKVALGLVYGLERDAGVDPQL